jgi:polyisoprenoid-binding protein YceI
MTQTATLPTTQDLAGTWAVDGAHSSAEFSAKHMMISTVRGRFDDFSGTVSLDENPSKSSVEVTFKTASISSGSPDRDGHLRSPDFLDVENHPDMTFVSKAVELTSDTTAKVTGDLTIRTVTRPVTLDVAFSDYLETDFWGKTRVAFTATTSISRKDWGLTWNKAMESGGVLVGDKVDIRLDIAAVKQ